MRKKQEEDAVSEALASMKYLVRHRGPVQYYMGNKPPGLVGQGTRARPRSSLKI